MRSSRAFIFILLIIEVFASNPNCFAQTSPGLCHHAISDDPHIFLEERENERVLRWVNDQNARTQKILESDPRYRGILADAKEILLAKDRIPFSGFSGGYFWNFWQGEGQKHGVWRRTTYEEYKKAEPKWETILDLDQLSAAEKENWVFKGATRLTPTSKNRLVHLSRGGGDAVVVREYDTEAKAFVGDGFNVPESNQSITPLDEDTIIIGTKFNQDSMTASNYPRILKLWKRGESLSDAKKIFEIDKTDLLASARLFENGLERYVVLERARAFFNSELLLLQKDGKQRKIPIPASAELDDIRNGKIIFQLKEDIGTKWKAGSTLQIGVGDTSLRNAQLIFQPAKNQSVISTHVASDRIFINLIENIRGRVLELKQGADGIFQSRVLPLPTTGFLEFNERNEDDPTSFTTINFTDHLTPTSQFRVHDEDDYRLELLKKEKERFDSTGLEVVQNFAKSADGTEVPYFLIKKKDLVLDGSSPTLLYGYGGFENSLTPSYLNSIGKVWVERGGVYVIANIRGGGEFGPEWHQAAIREKRQRAYDDFAAIAEDLIAKKITSPEHLGIHGASNGGLLTGTVKVQRPELFNAAIVQVPLLDMIRYTKLPKGASWVGEYGDPDVPADREFIIKYSPYQNVRADRRYPVPLFLTSTKDDRVHPAHARKMAARMIEQGHEILYYENINGGHAGSANLEEKIQMTALSYTYLWRQLSK